VADLTGAQNAPGGRTPESLLQFLADHRQSADRRRAQGRRLGGRSRAVIALALLGTCVLVWGSFTHFRFVSRGPTDTSAARHGSARTSTPQTSKATHPKPLVGNTERTAAVQAGLWHRGLQAWPDPAKPRLPDIYYKWLHSGYSCAVYASYGCWKAKVVTRYGCPHGLNVLVDETQNGVKVGVAIRFMARVLPRKPRYVEVDADRKNVDGHVGSMSCN